MTFRDFDAEAREAAGTPITFRKGGVEFICRHPFPVGSLIQFATVATEVEGMPANHPDRVRRMLVAIDQLLRTWITEDQHDAWSKVVAGIADVRELEQVAEWVIAEVTGRPSSAPSSSPTPVDSVGQSSTGA